MLSPSGRIKKLITRRGMGSSAAGRIQHGQHISWRAKQKTPELVRPQRPGATYSYEQKTQSPPENVETRNTRSTTAAYKDACRLLKNAPEITYNCLT